MQVPTTPNSRQEKMQQQRQLALKRQKEALMRRSQPHLLGAGAVVAQQNALHPKKAEGWSKFLVDPSLFDAPAQTSAPGKEEPVAAAVASTKLVAGALVERPRSGDSTATLQCDAGVSTEALSGGASPGSPGALSPGFSREDCSPARDKAEQGWDLQVGVSEAAGKEKGRGGLRFWRPWQGNRSASIAEEEVCAVSAFGDVEQERMPGRLRNAVDSRAVTPWAAGAPLEASFGETSGLPGLLEEEQRPCSRQQDGLTSFEAFPVQEFEN